MLKKLLISLNFLLLLAPNAPALPSLQIEEDHRITPILEKTPVVRHEGIHREYFNDGKLKSEVGYKDGQFNGLCRFYFQNGNLRKQFHYENGVVDGKAYEFYENGEYKFEANYKNGIVDDVIKLFYNNGNLYSFMVYQNGTLIQNYLLDPQGRTIKGRAR